MKSLNTAKLDIDHRMASHHNLETDLKEFEEDQLKDGYRYKDRVFQEKLLYKKWEISSNLDHLKDLFNRYPETLKTDKRYQEFFDKCLKHHC